MCRPTEQPDAGEELVRLRFRFGRLPLLISPIKKKNKSTRDQQRTERNGTSRLRISFLTSKRSQFFSLLKSEASGWENQRWRHRRERFSDSWPPRRRQRRRSPRPRSGRQRGWGRPKKRLRFCSVLKLNISPPTSASKQSRLFNCLTLMLTYLTWYTVFRNILA